MPRQRTAEHGSASLYRYGCRCGACVTGKARRDAAYVQSRRAELTGSVLGPVPPAHIDAQTGEVPMTPGQKKLAEIMAANRNMGSGTRIDPALRAKLERSDDGIQRVPVGEE